jgi:uncharacterized membrane protein (DUF485 family)
MRKAFRFLLDAIKAAYTAVVKAFKAVVSLVMLVITVIHAALTSFEYLLMNHPLGQLFVLFCCIYAAWILGLALFFAAQAASTIGLSILFLVVEIGFLFMIRFTLHMFCGRLVMTIKNNWISLSKDIRDELVLDPIGVWTRTKTFS